MKAKLPFLLVVVFLLAPFWAVSRAKVVDRVVAVVNNDVITQYDLDRALLVKPGEKHQVLNDLIHQKLLEQEMSKADIEVTDDDLARAIANVLEKNGINIEILRAELAAKGVSFDAYKEQLASQIRQAKFIQQHVASNIQVSDQDVKNYHSSQEGLSFQNATAHVAVIFFPIEPKTSARAIRHLVLKGRKLTDRARRGEDFAELARNYSEGAEGQEGGDLGTKTLTALPAAVASTIPKMEIGSVGDPIVTPQGVYIVKLYEKSGLLADADKVRDDDVVRASIYNDRVEQEINNYCIKLRRKAYIDIRE